MTSWWQPPSRTHSALSGVAHVIRLSAQAQQQFVELLLNPPAHVPAMKRALEAGNRLIADASCTGRFASSCRAWRKTVPVARVGRLAVDSKHQGQGLGAVLLAEAALRAARSEVAMFAMVVDARDDTAAAFYRHLGFEPLADDRRKMILPLEPFRREARG